jgi:hypothetical protein
MLSRLARQCQAFVSTVPSTLELSSKARADSQPIRLVGLNRECPVAAVAKATEKGEVSAVVSKTKFIRFGDQGFWVYDVAAGVFLKHLIDAAEASEHANTIWLLRAMEQWRLEACIQDYGISLDADWSPAQRQTFIALAEEACSRLTARQAIRAEEIVGWKFADDLSIFPRGATEVETAPVVELGRAIIALVSGQLPEAPEGTIWLYGTPSGRETIGWRNRKRAKP